MMVEVSITEMIFMIVRRGWDLARVGGLAMVKSTQSPSM